MPLQPAAILDLAWKSLDVSFRRGYSSVKDLMSDKIAMKTSSSGESVKYGWADLLPAVREWLGPRTHHSLTARSQEVINKDWELTLDVSRNVLDDQQVELYGPMAETFGRQFAIFKDKRLSEVITAGSTTTTFDGQFFYDTDHPIDPDGVTTVATQSNANSLDLSAANFQTVLAAAQNLKGRDNQSLGLYRNPDTLYLMGGPALDKTAREILNGDFISVSGGSTQSNTLKGAAQWMNNPYLNSTEWYLFDASMPVKPYLWQVRQDIRFDQLTQNTDPNVFEQRMYTYGMSMRGEAAGTLWFLSTRGNV